MPRTAHKTRQKRKRKREVKQAGGSDESVFTASDVQSRGCREFARDQIDEQIAGR